MENTHDFDVGTEEAIDNQKRRPSDAERSKWTRLYGWPRSWEVDQAIRGFADQIEMVDGGSGVGLFAQIAVDALKICSR